MATMNTMNTQAPAGTRVCASVREIAGGRSGGSWTKWTLKRLPAPAFVRAYARETSTKEAAAQGRACVEDAAQPDTAPRWIRRQLARRRSRACVARRLQHLNEGRPGNC